MNCKNLNRVLPPLKTKAVLWCGVPVQIPGVAWRDYEKETAFQIYCADWLRKQYELTKIEHYLRWHHSANEREGARAGFRARMMGQAKGWPDFVAPGLSCALELKVQGRPTTPEQRVWLDYFDRCGWRVEVVYRFERFRDIVLEETGRFLG